MVKLHYNWKYAFLRPTIEEVIKRYTEKFRPTVAARQAAGAAAAAAAAVATATDVAPAVTNAPA